MGIPTKKASTGASIPRWLALTLAPLVWLVAIPLVHGVLPWAISTLAHRYGWTEGRPAMWNLIGLLAIAAGSALLLRVLVHGYAEASRIPERVELNWAPKLFYAQGPYAFTRNPMYLGELALWLGWALLFGSWPVLLGAVVLWFGVQPVVRREERDLEARFGEAYRQYKAAVPRWMGKARRTP